MNKIKELEARIKVIEARNRKVELDKEWETSKTRKILILILTYFSIALYFNYVLDVNPWINAIVPTLGFLLSTFSLPLFKKVWERSKKL